MLARAFSGAVIGIDATLVEVEVDLSIGLPSTATVGLPEASVKESKERVKAAVINSGYLFPEDRITVNLAPADIRKEGTGFDLPIALGILAAIGMVPREALDNHLIIGELSLDGRVKPVRGALPVAVAARDCGKRGVMLSRENAAEAAVVNGIEVLPVDNLADAAEYFRGDKEITPASIDLNALFDTKCTGSSADFSEVQGQEHVKRALEVACAGGHNVILIGPPGSGKTMLARRLPSVLPPMSFEEALSTTKIYSVAGLLGKGQALVTERPFRSPHHTISDAGLIGGGRNPRPGEVSLAHNGVLFLDELPEFKKNVLEVMRQPLEDRFVNLSRAAIAVSYPASFMLVAAMNPCPCGYLGDTTHQCRCSPRQVAAYRSRVSGPLLDRIDIHVEVPAVAYKELAGTGLSEPSEAIRERVAKTRKMGEKRLTGLSIYCNAQMQNRHLKKFCRTDQASERLLEQAVDKLGLSARGYNRVLKIARTIADMAGQEDMSVRHIAEAIQYRALDRQGA